MQEKKNSGGKSFKQVSEIYIKHKLSQQDQWESWFVNL